MSKKAVRITALIAVALLVAAFFVFQEEILGEDAPEPQTDPAAAPPSSEDTPPIPVEAIVAQATSLRDAISVNGSTVPNEEVAITVEVAGKIERLQFEEGQFVKKGQVLLRLDDEELQAERQRLVVQRRLNQKIAERLKALYEKEGVSLQEYEVAAAEVEKTEAEITLLDGPFQIAIRSGDDSGVGSFHRIAAHALIFMFLKDAEQLDLEGSGEVAYFIEEERSVFGFADAPIPISNGAGESSFLMSKQLAIEQILIQSGAIDANERPFASIAKVVNRMSNKFFAGA